MITDHKDPTLPGEARAGRFTLDGDDALEARLAGFCRLAGEEVARVTGGDLDALVLGGGYGRGEGGVLSSAGGDQPYNDLEFFVLLRGPVPLSERRHGNALHDLGHRLSAPIGIEVEFKITSLDKLRRDPTTMFTYDLVCGHRVVAGPDNVLDPCARHRDAARIPLHEATRLLMNRCSGLLFAKERLGRSTFGEADADFTGRNIAKARLALGDVVLAALGRYHWSCRERHRRLAAAAGAGLPPALETKVAEWHQTGVEFKLHPCRSAATREQLAVEREAVAAGAWEVWRWLETRRLARPADSPGSYADDPGNKCPETFWLKNAAIRLRAFGMHGLLAGDRFRYPREGLLRTLPVLLWDEQEFATRAAAVSRWLGAEVAIWHDAVAAYERLWARFN